MSRRFLPALLLATAAVPPPPAGRGRPVSRQEILEAMAATQGYNLRATTNGPRFQSEVLRRLVREARARDLEQRPLFIGHEEWFSAYLERAGLSAEGAPVFVQLAHRFGQDMQVDYRTDRVVAEVSSGPAPVLAVNVCIWWPAQQGAADSYSYEDDLSTPRLKVTNERVISYRLLEFADVTLFGDVQGLRGRPTSGILGLLFRLIGEGRIVENRMALSADGLQVARARARKALFEVVSTVTVYPDGRTEKDLPAGRPDLAALDVVLKRPLAVRYQTMPCPP
jgi:hypothetical protein